MCVHRLYSPPLWCRRPRARATGITLIEMLISVTLTLLIMFAVVRVFEIMGSGLREGRATISMAGQLRSVVHRLQQDLDGTTAPTLPWIDPDSGMGYLELIEGPGNDRDSNADGLDDHLDGNADGVADQDSSLGDIDDVLMFTIRSQGEPFVGRLQGGLIRQPVGTLVVDPTVVGANGQPLEQVIESPVAEVVWWVQFDDVNSNGTRDFTDLNGNNTRDSAEPFIESLMLYRRLLLVRPDLDLTRVPVDATRSHDFFNANDVSARHNTNGGGFVANSLSDLSKRENRFGHLIQRFPFVLNRTWLIPTFALYHGEDVMLGDVLSFDVRVYDPQAPIHQRSNVGLSPGDPGYPKTPSEIFSAAMIGRGAYVDLNYARDGTSPLVGSYFSGPSHPKSRLFVLANGSPASVYDTWPSHYERDGLDQDAGAGDGSENVVDEGSNGLDDDNKNGVDDVGERETAAPYGVPLRGVQVTVRMMDYGTRQVRQVSVVGDFVPE